MMLIKYTYCSMMLVTYTWSWDSIPCNRQRHKIVTYTMYKRYKPIKYIRYRYLLKRPSYLNSNYIANLQSYNINQPSQNKNSNQIYNSSVLPKTTTSKWCIISSLMKNMHRSITNRFYRLKLSYNRFRHYLQVWQKRIIPLEQYTILNYTKQQTKDKKNLLFASIEKEEFIPICPFNWDSATVVLYPLTDSDLSNSPTEIGWSKID